MLYAVFFAILAIGGFLMAKLSDVQASLDAQTAAIKALADAIAARPAAAATEADLDGVKASIDANTAAVQAIPTT